MILVLLHLFVKTAEAQENFKGYYLINEEVLLLNQKLIERKDKSFNAEMEELNEMAEEIISKKERYSVVFKKYKVAPSGYPNDYYSESPYFYLDEKGKVYKKDAERNPLVDKNKDRRQMQDMVRDLKVLSLAYFYSSDTRFSDWACVLLKTWFIDKTTKMNPNLSYAQMKPLDTIGSSSGIIESRDLVLIPDILKFFERTMWHDQVRGEVMLWYKDYLEWLETSDLAKIAANQQNNIGNFYDLQLYTYNLFTGSSRKDVVNLISSRTGRKICYQINEIGEQPEELRRANPISYSLLNLRTLMQIGLLSKNIGAIDFWEYNCKASSLSNAFKWIQNIVLSQSYQSKGKVRAVTSDQLDQFKKIKLVFYPDVDADRINYYLDHGNIVDLVYSM